MQYYLLWFLGTLGTLAYKYVSYVRYGKAKGVSLKTATLDWFFEPSLLNAASWLSTLSASWLCSTVYIEKLEFPFLSLLLSLPLHGSVALFLGICVEMLAPFITKWLVNRATHLLSLIK